MSSAPAPSSRPSPARIVRALSALRVWTPLIPIAVFVLAIVSHATILGNGFVGDDFLEISANPIMDAPLDLRTLWSAEYMSGYQGRVRTGHYRPLVLLIQKIEYDLFGFNPLPYHLTVLGLHALLAALIAEFLRRRCGLRLGAFLGGAIFAVHPALTEAAVSSFGLKEVLAGLLSFAALLVYSGWREDRPVDRGLRLAASSALLAGGIFGKESALPFFLVLPAWDLLRGAPARPIKELLRRSLRPALLHGALFAAVVFTTLTFRAGAVGGLLRVPTGSPINNPLLAEADPLVRAGTALRVAALAFRILILPFRLSFDYSADSIPLAGSLLEPAVIAGLVVLSGLGVLLLLGHRLLLPAGVGAVITSLTYVLTSNLVVAFGTLFSERFLYLPAAGLCLVAAPYLQTLLRTARAAGRPALRVGALLAPALVIAGLTALSLARTAVFRDDRTLLLDAWSHYPRNLVLESALVVDRFSRGEFSKAREALQDLERRRPDFPFVLETRARLELAAGHRGEALTWYTRAIERPEADITTFRILAEMLANDGKIEEAIHVLSLGLRDPIGDYHDRARARELRGVLLQDRGKLVQALADLEIACAIDPRLSAAWGDLAEARLASGDTAGAREALGRALAIQPRSRLFLSKLARLDAAAKDFPTAAARYRRLIEVDPSDMSARSSLGGCLIALGDHAGAKVVFEDVVRLSPDDRYALASLGSLDAAAGNIEAARRSYERFLSRAQPEDDLTRQVRERLGRLPSR